jgi:8-oxo-dGTP pyrophosphatase MutT (NUDIX family)
MSSSIPLPVVVRRRAFRLAYALLRVYWFVTRPSVHGVKCVLIDGERVLLVRHTYGRSEWELPGGSIKRNESPVGAARREMHEELGITIDDWTPLGVLNGRMDHRHDTLYCFQADLRDAALTPDPGEIDVVSWFAHDQLPPELGRYVRPVLAQRQDS